MRHETTQSWGTEVVLEMPNGMQLHADGEDPDGTSYVRVCDPQGVEVMYWNAEEWRDEPSSVMGAIIGALCVIEMGDPAREADDVTEDDAAVEDFYAQYVAERRAKQEIPKTATIEIGVAEMAALGGFVRDTLSSLKPGELNAETERTWAMILRAIDRSLVSANGG